MEEKEVKGTKEKDTNEKQEKHQKQKRSSKKELLEKELDELKEQLKESEDKYLRLHAEFDNYQKRVLKEIETAKESMKRSLINEFLVVLDSMEKALAASKEHKDSIIEGIELTMKSFKDLLKRHGVEEVNPDKEQFDPDLHDALMVQPSDDLPKDTVMQTLQKGYIYKDKLIRPAKVIVSSGAAQENKNIDNEKED